MIVSPRRVGDGLLAACGGASSEDGSGQEQVTFGFSHPFAEGQIVAVITRQVREIGEDDGWKVLLDETGEGNVQNQLGTIDTWITQKVTAINAFPTDPSAFETAAGRAVDESIIWTSSAVPMKTGAGGILFPPELSGDMAGKATVDWINANDPEAEVLILETPLAGEPKKRTEIPKKLIEQKTRAKIVAIQPAIDHVKGLEVTEDVLQAHPNVTVVVAFTDEGALGAADAFRRPARSIPPRWGSSARTDRRKRSPRSRPGTRSSRHRQPSTSPSCARKSLTSRSVRLSMAGKPGDKQEHVELAPTLVKVGDTQLIDRFAATYQ